MDCLFCKIINNELPSTRVYEDESVIGFKDIHPLAKEHYLFIARKHTKNVNELSDKNPEDLLSLFNAIRKFTQEKKIDTKGFRLVTNQGEEAGQTVFHTHFHILSGEKLGTFGR